MPQITTSVNILRQGPPKRRTQPRNDEAQSDEIDKINQIRDHYLRYELFYKKQYPKRKQEPFAGSSVTDLATQADRDTVLGIVDTIAREYITFWLPEIELFLDGDAYADPEREKAEFLKLFNGLIDNVVRVASRIDVSNDVNAATLQQSLNVQAKGYMTELYSACKDTLNRAERQRYKPESVLNAIKMSENSTKSVQKDTLSETQILDSSTAWDLAETKQSESVPVFPRSPSPKKRAWLPGLFLHGPDPEDNGQVWATPLHQTKRQKLEIEFTSTMKLQVWGEEGRSSDSNSWLEDEAMADSASLKDEMSAETGKTEVYGDISLTASDSKGLDVINGHEHDQDIRKAKDNCTIM